MSQVPMGGNQGRQGQKGHISWEEITRPWKEGGLDIWPFEKQAQAL